MFVLRRAGLPLALVLGVVCLSAQDSRRFRLQGEVSAEGGSIPTGLSVEVYDMAGHTPLDKVPVHQQGSFEVNNLTSHQVEVRLVSFEGEVIRKEHVSIGNGFAPLTLRLPAFAGAKPPQGTVSVHQLNHTPSKKAQKSFRKSQDVFQKGDLKKSIELLQQAVREDPLYLEAWNNLGSRYMRANDPDRALSALRHAQELDGDSTHVLTNLGIVLLHKGQKEEAEVVARRAMRQLRADTKAEYVLGMSLFQSQKNLDDALLYLGKAKTDFPQARLTIAHILIRAGHVPEGRRELETYLTVSHEREAFVRNWLAMLDKPPSQTAAGQ